MTFPTPRGSGTTSSRNMTGTDGVLTVTLPTHQAGDVLLVLAGRGSTAAAAADQMDAVVYTGTAWTKPWTPMVVIADRIVQAFWKIAESSSETLQVQVRDVSAAKTITNITQANGAVVTSAGHGLATGTRVLFASVVGMTEINGLTGVITAADTDTFTIGALDTSGFSAYSSGGTATAYLSGGTNYFTAVAYAIQDGVAVEGTKTIRSGSAGDEYNLPPNLAVSGTGQFVGAKDYLWIAGFANGTSLSSLTAPSGFSNLVYQSGTGTTGCSTALATKELNASSLSFTAPNDQFVPSADGSCMATLIVAPSGASAVTISSVNDTTLNSGQTGITITGTLFGSTQGTGKVIISPTDDVSDVNAVEQTINGWGDTSINITAVRSTLSHSTDLYLFVVNGSDESNANGYVVQFNPDRKLKVLVHSSAAGATGIKGVVFAAPSTGTIAGEEIGEFSGKTFEETLESDQAVLKVPIADFNGNSLTTSDTPVVLVRNDTNTTGIINATIIEE